MRLTGWWQRRSGPARIELYTRYSFYFFAVVELLTLGGPIIRLPIGPRIGLTTLVIVHSALCAGLSATGLDWILGRRKHPLGLLAAVAALTLCGALAVPALHAAGTSVGGGDAAMLVVGLVAFGLGAMVPGIRRASWMVYGVLGAAAATFAIGALLGLSGPVVAALAVAVLVTSFVTALTSGCSIWLLTVVWELDAARELQSQLAVAQERLRFGRDLHDVMGRNLAVIALKSELAVQLARRGQPEAAEQMIEVQRIARESQREVRDVVRGYREADLAVELAGALSVLRAAGIDARSEGDDGTKLPAEVQAALGWVVREATTNVLRHSEAQRCTIRVTTGASVVLSVDNDGVPEPAVAGGSGSGLAGLGERLATLGGTVRAESQAGVFRLTARVPLSRATSPGVVTQERGAAV